MGRFEGHVLAKLEEIQGEIRTRFNPLENEVKDLIRLGAKHGTELAIHRAALGAVGATAVAVIVGKLLGLL